MYYIGVRDEKKNEKGVKIKSRQLGFLSHNMLGHSQCVYNLKAHVLLFIMGTAHKNNKTVCNIRFLLQESF